MQSWGRGSRIAPGKTTFIILDHVGNYTRHGLCDSERTWSLEGAKAAKIAQEKPIVVRTCPSCFACHEPAPVCPMCGHVYEVKTHRVDYSDGELMEIKEEYVQPCPVNEMTLDQRVKYGQHKGYKNAGWWALNYFKR
jgi:hypothetical protein